MPLFSSLLGWPDVPPVAEPSQVSANSIDKEKDCLDLTVFTLTFPYQQIKANQSKLDTIGCKQNVRCHVKCV